MITWLGQEEAHDVKLTGGKAAMLSRLAALHRVPPGFVLTSQAFSAVGSFNGDLTPAMRSAIADSYGRLGRPCVAVRSSAVDEDGHAHSFAGQHDTFLNVEGEADVTAAVARCVASAFSPRALDYRRSAGLRTDRVGLAVLVQELVLADAAAVAFSANPVSGSRDEILITANYGLGESIVGGTATPDTFVVRKDVRAIVSRVIGDKRKMTVAVMGGTREVDTPALLRTLPSLTDAQVLSIADLAAQLESTMAAPVDVECGIHNGLLYLLQARPITTLASKTRSQGAPG